ncbi:unnamed protein product [Discosporangium mesarthrocarpum]
MGFGVRVRFRMRVTCTHRQRQYSHSSAGVNTAILALGFWEFLCVVEYGGYLPLSTEPVPASCYDMKTHTQPRKVPVTKPLAGRQNKKKKLILFFGERHENNATPW